MGKICLKFVDVIHEKDKVIKFVNTEEEAKFWRGVYASWGYKLLKPVPNPA